MCDRHHILRIVLVGIICGLFWAGPIVRAEEPGVGARIVASTVKTAAKAYVAATDMRKLREITIARIQKMTSKRFQTRYGRVYRAFQRLPIGLKVRYALPQTITKAEAIRRVSALDKKQLYEIIDALPDDVVTDEFNRYLRREKQVAPGA